MTPMPTRSPPGASPTAAELPQTEGQRANIPASLSASGSTFSLRRGSHAEPLFSSTSVGWRYHDGSLKVLPSRKGDSIATFGPVDWSWIEAIKTFSQNRSDPEPIMTAPTTIPSRPTRPPPLAPLPESLRSSLSPSDVILVRRDLGRSMLQKTNLAFGRIQLKLLESFLEVSWQPTPPNPDLGRLWIGIRSKAFVREGCPEVFCWPMHLTLFKADFVRRPSDARQVWMQRLIHDALSAHWFIAAGDAYVQLEAGDGYRLILYLHVGTAWHMVFMQLHHEVCQEVWVDQVSTAPYCQKQARNFHISLD